MSDTSANRVRVFEVGPRDGLQNEPRLILLKHKIQFVKGLLKSGISDLELGAFVREDRVPQMADTQNIFEAIHSGRLRLGKARAWSLVPNRKGMARALAAGAKQVAVFTAATESFTERNIGMSIRQSLQEFKEVVRLARENGIEVRGYVSTAFWCPFEGKTSASKALKVIESLADLGVFQVSIGDTIGMATPKDVDRLIGPALKLLGVHRTAVHFHDTRGTALANALRSFELGVRTIDSSAGGLGGCPYAPGATGNLATEDLVYMLHGMGVQTGIDLKTLCRASLTLIGHMHRPISSRYLQAFSAVE